MMSATNACHQINLANAMVNIQPITQKIPTPASTCVGVDFDSDDIEASLFRETTSADNIIPGYIIYSKAFLDKII